jgi:CheY-like chemotaxis protein
MPRANVPILLVEDDQVDIKTVQRAFSIHKITNRLYTAKNGREGLDFLRHGGGYNRVTAPRPGIILLDLNMPIMGGLEFLTEIKRDQDLRAIPVVVLTTSQMENDLVQSYKLGSAGYIIKPVDFSKFLEAVKIFDLYWTLCELP